MSKFKVGDKIVVQYCEHLPELNGMTGTVSAVEDDKIWCNDWSDGEAGWFSLIC